MRSEKSLLYIYYYILGKELGWTKEDVDRTEVRTLTDIVSMILAIKEEEKKQIEMEKMRWRG